MSKGELKRLTDEFVEKMLPLIGPEKDIPAPDVYTDAETMGWFMNRYSAMAGYTVPGVVTGKPISVGGSLGRDEATGRGCFITILRALEYLGLAPDKATVAVQGFGNAGYKVAELLHDAGVKIVALSDSKGAIKNNSRGLDPRMVLEYKRKAGTVVGFPESEEFTNEALLEEQVTVLVPAALEGVITFQNAARIRARIIAEAANGPTTPDADPILNSNGIFTIPDILANSGGVVVSYFEWVQGLQRFFWKIERVRSELEEVVSNAFRGVVGVTEKLKVPMKTAAMIIAVEKVVKAGIDRGKAI